LLFSLLSAGEDDDIPSLPNYLEDGLAWLVTKLQVNNSPSSSEADILSNLKIESKINESMEAVPDDEE
jgi:hypothetical protein